MRRHDGEQAHRCRGSFPIREFLPTAPAIRCPTAPMDITFSLYDDTLAETPVWTEQQAIAVTGGMCTAVLGVQEPIIVTFDRPFWLTISVGSQEPSDAWIPVLPAPYAFNARNADSAIVS